MNKSTSYRYLLNAVVGVFCCQVNSVNVLSSSAVTVLDLVVSSSHLNVVLARQRGLH